MCQIATSLGKRQNWLGVGTTQKPQPQCWRTFGGEALRRLGWRLATHKIGQRVVANKPTCILHGKRHSAPRRPPSWTCVIIGADRSPCTYARETTEHHTSADSGASVALCNAELGAGWLPPNPYLAAGNMPALLGRPHQRQHILARATYDIFVVRPQPTYHISEQWPSMQTSIENSARVLTSAGVIVQRQTVDARAHAAPWLSQRTCRGRPVRAPSPHGLFKSSGS